MQRITLIAAALAAGLALGPAVAQDFPAKPVKVIVPQPPGGGFDFSGRVMAERLSVQTGQQFVVENRSGAGTIVGTEAAARATPDGYTLYLGGTPSLSFNAGLYRKLPFDPVADFISVGVAASFSYTLVARKDLAQNTLEEILAFARANPGRLTYGSGGNGTGQHIAAAVLAHLTNVNMVHVPYKGASAAYQDLLAGRIDLFFDNTGTARPQVDSGAVKPIAVSAAQRLSFHPTVPTVIEAARIPLEVESFFGYFAPAKTPQPVIDKLRAEFARAVQSPEVIGRFEKAGYRVMRVQPTDLDAFVRRDIEKWTKLIRDADVRAD